MPRYTIKTATRSPKHDKLVKRLAQEIKSPGDDPQPLILEEAIDATRSRHVNVVWDQWQGLSDDQRCGVIIDAYVQAEGSGLAEAITIAAGATPEEAVALVFLPYKVVPLRGRHENKPPMAAYRKALAAEVRHTVLGLETRELRYARIEDAREAKKRLEAALAGSEWEIIEEIQSPLER